MNVLVIHPVSDKAISQIIRVDPQVTVIDARGWFDGEIRDTWPQWTAKRYLGDRKTPAGSRPERDRVLAEADIILGGFPFPLDLRARASRLRWFHQLPAGASNLLRGDLWGSDVMVTTSRAYGNTHPMAEYVLAGFLHFAKGLHRAYRDRSRHRFDHSLYHPVLLQGKTVCIVGAGGIGGNVARLCAGVEMRVVGARRRKPAEADRPPEFSRLEGSGHLYELLGESEFVAVCCQWTPETTKLIDSRTFAAMKPGTVLVNVGAGKSSMKKRSLTHSLRKKFGVSPWMSMSESSSTNRTSVSGTIRVF